MSGYCPIIPLYNPLLPSHQDSLLQKMMAVQQGVHLKRQIAQQEQAATDFRDYLRAPSTEQERNRIRKFIDELHSVRQEVNDWEGTGVPTATDRQIKNDNLARLAPKLAELERQLCEMRGDNLYKESAIPAEENAGGVSKSPTVNRPQKNIWNPTNQRKLLEELAQPGSTFASVARDHGISRQAISKAIKKAKENVGPTKKATVFDALLKPKTKK